MSVKSKVQTKAEEALFAHLQLVAQFLGVANSSLCSWVADAAFLGVNLLNEH
jgi:hypothetical protein